MQIGVVGTCLPPFAADSAVSRPLLAVASGFCVHRHFSAIRLHADGRPMSQAHKTTTIARRAGIFASGRNFVRVTNWILGAVLTAAPFVYAQNAPNQQPTQPQAPAATDQSNAGQNMSQPTSTASQPTDMQQNSTTMPQSDQASQTSSNSAQQNDNHVIYGTGMTAAELKNIGYTDAEIAQMRSDATALQASAPAATTPAAINQDQANAANSVSQPSDANANSNNPQRAQSSNYAGVWGLLGLLGLLGLAGRARSRAVVHHEDVDTVRERDRMRYMTEDDAATRASRDREMVGSTDMRDRDIATRHDSDALADDAVVQENLRRKEMRDRVHEMKEEDRKRRRIA
jgi:hypothetical protein